MGRGEGKGEGSVSTAGRMADVTEVREKHRFNEENLHSYLKRNLAEFRQDNGGLSVLQFR